LPSAGGSVKPQVQPFAKFASDVPRGGNGAFVLCGICSAASQQYRIHVAAV